MATMDDKNDQATLESESALPGFEQPSNVSVTLPLLYGKMTLGEALDEEDNVLLPLSYSSQRQYFFFFGSMSIVKTSRLSYHSISPLRKAKHADLESLRSGNTAALMFVYRYTLIIGEVSKETGASSATAALQSWRVDISRQCRRETPHRSRCLHLDSRKLL